MLKMNPITVRIVNINIGKEKTSLLDCGCPKEGQQRNPFQVYTTVGHHLTFLGTTA